MSLIKNLIRDEQGVVPAEYVVFVAALGILLAGGVFVLFNGLSALFGAWAAYFGAGN